MLPQEIYESCNRKNLTDASVYENLNAYTRGDISFSRLVEILNEANTSYLVTVTNLDLALRMVGMTFDKKSLAKFIEVFYLLESKGDGVTIMDICEMQAKLTACCSYE